MPQAGHRPDASAPTRARASASPAASGRAAGWPGATSLVGAAGRRAGRRRHLARLLLLRARRAGRRRRRQRAPHARPGRRPPPACPSGEPLARVDLDADPHPGRGAGRGRARPTSPGTWPDEVLIAVDRARRRSRSSRSAASCAGWTPTASSSATTPGARRTCPGSRPTAATAPTRCARPPRWSPRCPATWPRGRPRRGRRPSTRSPWCCATAGPCVGERGRVREEGRGAARRCSRQPGQVYDVSVPGQPTDPRTEPGLFRGVLARRPACRRRSRAASRCLLS